jgi:RHS repeat-associated protein
LNEAAVSFTYTATGKRATMTDASGTTTYHYDNRDRLISKITPQGTLSYTYDGANNVLSITSSNTNGASLSYSYDADDRLSTAVDNGLQAQGGAGVTSYGYDPGGNLTAYIYSNTVQTSYSYDTLNRLTSTQSSCGTAASGCATPGSPMASFVYTLDAAGNRTNVVELNGRSVTYGYDNDYRLTSEMISKDVSQNGSIAYTYDAGGNRTQITSSVPAIPSSGTLTYDANDRSTTDPYDNNGNLLNSGTGTNTWEFENRLIQDGNVSIIYDGDGNRVSETASGVTTKYLVDTMNPTGYAQVVDELVNGSVSRTYAYGLQRISENQLIGGVWTPSFYGYDGHGSVRFLTNSSALVTDTYEYDAFGNLLNHTGSTPNNYLFAGEQFDPALNVYQMRARWYRQATGRFISRDPVEGVLCCSLSWNPYIYVKQNPVNAVDPTGRDAIIDYAIELGESEESIAALRLTRVLVRTELFEECLVEQIIELREFGWPLLAAIAEAHIYCNALYPPIL